MLLQHFLLGKLDRAKIVICWPEGELSGLLIDISTIVASAVKDWSTPILVIGFAKLSIIVRFMNGALFRTSAVTSITSTSNSSSVTINVILQIPPSLQLNSVQQSSESILSINPGFLSIAKRHSTSPPSSS